MLPGNKVNSLKKQEEISMMKEMSTKELKKHLYQYIEDFKAGRVDLFQWPTDGTGYYNHIRFVEYRNKYWKGGSSEDWIEFVKKYIRRI